MRDIVAVHPDMFFEDRYGTLGDRLGLYRQVICQIARAIDSVLESGGKAYMLLDEHHRPFMDFLDGSGLSGSRDRLAILPPESHEMQFMRLKGMMIDEGSIEADIAGFCYGMCVRDTYFLLKGRQRWHEGDPDGDYRKGSLIPRYWYRQEYGDLGRSQGFRKFYSTSIDAVILDDLTDKFLPQ